MNANNTAVSSAIMFEFLAKFTLKKYFPQDLDQHNGKADDSADPYPAPRAACPAASATDT